MTTKLNETKAHYSFKHACFKASTQIICTLLRNRNAQALRDQTYNEIFHVANELYKRGNELNYFEIEEKKDDLQETILPTQ